jgi:hypothetical protein
MAVGGGAVTVVGRGVAGARATGLRHRAVLKGPFHIICPSPPTPALTRTLTLTPTPSLLLTRIIFLSAP